MRIFSMAFDEGSCFFKFKRCLFEFKGRKFMLYPGNDDYYMSIDTVVKDEIDMDKAFQDIHEFLYLYGWKNHFSFQFLDACSMGPANDSMLVKREAPFFRIPRKMRSTANLVLMESVNCSQEVKNMLSLYNDAMHSDNIFFRFLCLYKVIDLHFKGSTDKIKKWINANFKICGIEIQSIKYYNSNIDGDLEKYLRDCLRNAIAHSHLTDVRKIGMLSYKPDDYGKTREGCYILEKLVQHLISSLMEKQHSQIVNVMLEE